MNWLVMFGLIKTLMLWPRLPSSLHGEANYPFSIHQSIREARGMLAHERIKVEWCRKRSWVYRFSGRARRKIVRTETFLCYREQVLAVANPETGRVEIIRVGDMGRNETKIIGLWRVTRHNENGVNSEYEVREHARSPPRLWPVVGLKTKVRRGAKERDLIPVAYVPYSEALNTRELQWAGASYLIKLQFTALESMAKYPTLEVTRACPHLSQAVIVLSLIEHMDITEFKERGAPYMIGKVLTTIGANQEEAYRYAVSDIKRRTRRGVVQLPGARGLMQFIPSTYQDIYRRCQAARLKRDFFLGTNDHVNATKAAYCLFERDWNLLGNKRPCAAWPADLLHSYLAAAYNAGPHRAKEAFVLKDFSRFIYVQEFLAVYHLLFQEREE